MVGVTAYVQIRLNAWNQPFYNALANRDLPGFFQQLGFFAGLRPVEIHRELMTAAARWMMALKLWSVLSARMAMRLNSLSLQKKFSIR